jgi:uncharacterized protein with von Willebrand factor type A (vWA) domain
MLFGCFIFFSFFPPYVVWNYLVSKLQDSWRYIKQNETIQYWSQTLKESLKESFNETLGISEDNYDDEDLSEDSRDDMTSDVMALEEQMRSQQSGTLPSLSFVLHSCR